MNKHLVEGCTAEQRCDILATHLLILCRPFAICYFLFLLRLGALAASPDDPACAHNAKAAA